jgi:NADH-quinone oxidoreductase subunit A
MSYGYFQNYIPVLLFFGVLVLLAAAMLLLSRLLGPRRPSRVKLAPYECGIVPTGDTRQSIDVGYYLVGLVFILFDVAVAFLYPWAVIFHELRMYGFIAMSTFLLLIVPGFVYVWRKGVLDWGGPEDKAGERT